MKRENRMDGKTTANEVTSTQQSLSSSHDPGWNDPPKWAFSPIPDTRITPTKRLLNKRIAFPLSSVTAGASSTSDQPVTGFSPNLPPPVESSSLTSAPHAPLCAPTGKIVSLHSQADTINKNEALEETMKNLEVFMSEKLKSSDKIEEVRRRLDTMKIMWKEDKLKEEACKKVLEISKALRNNDVEAADKVHVSLVMEHAAVCNTWISGLRHMILELREKTSETNCPLAAQDSHPYLLPRSVKEDENT